MSAANTARSTRQTAKNRALAAVAVLQKSLDIFKDVAEQLGVPWLKTGIGILSTILKMVQVRLIIHEAAGVAIMAPH